jgi:hypothetical protein
MPEDYLAKLWNSWMEGTLSPYEITQKVGFYGYKVSILSKQNIVVEKKNERREYRYLG